MVETERVRFQVRVTPKSSRNAILGWVNDVNNIPTLKISVTTVPEKGKANEAIIQFLSKTWKIAKSDIIIEKGDADRQKVLSIPSGYAHLLSD